MPGNASSGGGGNRRKSLQHHQLAGTYRKDRHEALKSPEPPAVRPEPPAPLGEVSQGEWDRMMGRLEQSQSLFVVDDAAVYQYCQLYAETEQIALDQESLAVAVERLEENLGDFKGEDFLKLVQELTTQRKLIAKCTDQLRAGRMAIRQYLVEFGLTPASRGRIKLPAGKEAVDEFTAYQHQRVG